MVLSLNGLHKDSSNEEFIKFFGVEKNIDIVYNKNLHRNRCLRRFQLNNNDPLFAVCIDCNGRKCYHNNNIGRPAWICFNVMDNQIIVSYIDNGSIHKFNSPATIRYRNGIVIEEECKVNNVLHNLNGPAKRVFARGRWENYFFINGMCLNLDEYISYKEKV